jgi:zinc transport system permease protein
VLDLLAQTFFHHALVAGTLVGAMCSFVGVYVLLKRIVFLGIALAQVASAGIALALLAGWNPLLTALAASLGGAVIFARVRWRGRLPVEGVLGATYAVAGAVGTILMARNPVGEARALTVLFGNILSVPTAELTALVIVAVAVVIVHLRFRKEFVFVSFDSETAAAHGVDARFWDLMLYLTLGVAIAFAIRSAGIMVTFALLVIPAVGARLLTTRVGPMFGAAVGLGTLSVPIGLVTAFAMDLPTGATISLSAAVLFGAAVAGRRLAGRGRWPAVAGAAIILLASLPPARPAGGAPPPRPGRPATAAAPADCPGAQPGARGLVSAPTSCVLARGPFPAPPRGRARLTPGGDPTPSAAAEG